MSTPHNAIVTGGSRGIGRSIVERLHEGGAHVVTCGRGRRPIDLSGDVRWVQADVAEAGAAERIVSEATDAIGPITLLVNNAGVQVEKTVLESTDADWDLVVGTNCRALFRMCRAVLPGMTRFGGVIVNIGSISATLADPSMALYNASKAFVHGLTRSIAVDHGPAVRCNTIAPGWIATDMADAAFAARGRPGRGQARFGGSPPCWSTGHAGRHSKRRDLARITRCGLRHRTVLHRGWRTDIRIATAHRPVLTCSAEANTKRRQRTKLPPTSMIIGAAFLASRLARTGRRPAARSECGGRSRADGTRCRDERLAPSVSGPAHLGRFLQQPLDGELNDIVARKIETNLMVVGSSLVGALVPLALFVNVVMSLRTKGAGPPVLREKRDRDSDSSARGCGVVGSHGHRPGSQRFGSRCPCSRGDVDASDADRHRYPRD